MALMILGALITGCVSMPRSGPQPDDRALTRNSDLSGACEKKRTYFPKAAAYAGSAPHPIIAFSTSELGSVLEVSTSYWDSDRPLEWGRVEADHYQLVACLGKAAKGDFVTTCTFDNGSEVPLHRGRYDVAVYEAATGKKLGTEQMQGSAGSSHQCPFFTMVSKRNPILYTEPDYDQFRAVLGKYVDSPANAVPATTSAAAKPKLVTDITGLCDALAADIPEQARSLPIRRTGSGNSLQSCTWGSESYDRNNPAPPPRLRVTVTAHGDPGSATSAVGTAKKQYETAYQS
ncbi:hypothetical protein ACFWFG_38265, partial [Streptomyces roseolus]